MTVNRGVAPEDSEIIYTLRDPEKLYSRDQVCDLLEKAEALGIPLDKGTILEDLTIAQLDELVNRR